MPSAVRALRGATTCEVDDPAQITERTVTLLQEMFARNGVDHESQALCPQMTHFSQMSDFEAYSIVKYLRSIPKVSKKVPRSVCPPTKTKEQQDLPH